MFASLSKNAAYRFLISLLWMLVLVGLPLTSLPLLNRLTNAIVAPFSAIPLAVLLVVWLVPFLAGRGKFPVEVLPFLYFVLIVLAVSALAFFLDGYYVRDLTFFDQTLRAVVTLGIGLSFYLVVSTLALQENHLRQAFIFIYVGGFLLILWTAVEVVMLRKVSRVQELPQWLTTIRSALAVQSPNVFYTNRVTGFAYEPSWFVRQFNLVLFPIWLSAVYQRKSVFKFRLWIFQVEDFLMLGGLVVFGFSSPRIGLLAFLASVAFVGLLIFGRFHRQVFQWYLKKRKNRPTRTTWLRIALAGLMIVVMFGLAAGALTGYIVVASRWDSRYQLLLEQVTTGGLDIFPLTETRLILMSRDLAFFERMIYWFAGWNIFNDYPFGVGLGNAGFYFFENMHGLGMDSVEIRNLAYRAGYIPNTKNLWTRLLSETGFIGLAVFLVWLYILWRSAGLIRRSHAPLMKILGLAGQLFLLAYLVEGFSMDSFAMPYQWVMAGLISAGGLLARRELSAKDRLQELQLPQV